MEKLIFASAGLVFAAIGIIALIILGNDAGRSYAILATLVLAAGQFIAQDARAHLLANLIMYLGFGILCFAWVSFSLYP